MAFTKTSQKFGQWSDVRANTVYGLGFSSEIELNKVKYVKDIPILDLKKLCFEVLKYDGWNLHILFDTSWLQYETYHTLKTGNKDIKN